MGQARELMDRMTDSLTTNFDLKAIALGRKEHRADPDADWGNDAGYQQDNKNPWR